MSTQTMHNMQNMQKMQKMQNMRNMQDIQNMQTFQCSQRLGPKCLWQCFAYYFHLLDAGLAKKSTNGEILWRPKAVNAFQP